MTKPSPQKPPRSAARRAATINLRLPETVKALIDAAAEASGKSRTEFVLDSAQSRAIDVLLDRRLMMLDGAQWDAFQNALDDPPAPAPRLERLMREKAPWDR
ncbi:DUF1778 domain-containing protein [Prosthecomicrobium pneumaticum]|uniref:Uncharacterized protein (DUF1778 family) n=1 Tax=Prosthecomicrobium pneumaticum TaxID=81895 RepID=A0A7W9CTW1_9HYPH|nr:DUF1778 domain-containing protein [Prosthecomicrobium pneumaticum]MBB5751790.1 uncharacterized protein (DUF1778 family) [Prosthecomicrobium pneumaticum]